MSQKHDGITDSNHPDWKAYRPEGEGRTDEQIRADVHEVLQREGDGNAQFELDVADGIVTIRGDLEEESDLLERIRAIPSVKSARAEQSGQS